MVKRTILEAVVKGLPQGSFATRVGDQFVVKQKRGDRGPALCGTTMTTASLVIYNVN